MPYFVGIGVNTANHLAVATLPEARRQAMSLLVGRRYTLNPAGDEIIGSTDDHRYTLDQASSLTEHVRRLGERGGNRPHERSGWRATSLWASIGPLPDGTYVEVVGVRWSELAELAGRPRRLWRGQVERGRILDAWNRNDARRP